MFDDQRIWRCNGIEGSYGISRTLLCCAAWQVTYAWLAPQLKWRTARAARAECAWHSLSQVDMLDAFVVWCATSWLWLQFLSKFFLSDSRFRYSLLLVATDTVRSQGAPRDTKRAVFLGPWVVSGALNSWFTGLSKPLTTLDDRRATMSKWWAPSTCRIQ